MVSRFIKPQLIEWCRAYSWGSLSSNSWTVFKLVSNVSSIDTTCICSRHTKLILKIQLNKVLDTDWPHLIILDLTRFGVTTIYRILLKCLLLGSSIPQKCIPVSSINPHLQSVNKYMPQIWVIQSQQFINVKKTAMAIRYARELLHPVNQTKYKLWQKLKLN